MLDRFDPFWVTNGPFRIMFDPKIASNRDWSIFRWLRMAVSVFTMSMVSMGEMMGLMRVVELVVLVVVLISKW